MVGVGGLFVDLAVLYLGLWLLSFSWIWAKLISFLAAATFTWWMNRKFTFGKSNKPLILEWASFLATNAFGGLVNLSVYSAVVTQFYPYVWLPAIATCLGSIGGLVFNYLSSRHLVFNQTSKLEKIAKDSIIMETPPFPKSLYWVTACVCIIFGWVTVYFGFDANWGLKNHHWFNGWAFVNDLIGRDWSIKYTTSFDNPVIDVPYAWLVERIPLRAVGFLLGMLHGLNFLPLSAIAWHLSTLSNLQHRMYASAIVAMVGICGAGGLSEIGLVFYDNILSLGVFSAILLCLAHWDKISQNDGFKDYLLIVLFGVPAGLIVGLKQSFIIFCLGLTIAFLFTDLAVLRRIRASIFFSAGILLGFSVSGGYWALHLWSFLGNPFFPYFNHIFKAPLALPISYFDPSINSLSLLHKLFLGFQLCWDVDVCANTNFRDFRILSLLILIGLAVMLRLWRKQAHPFTHFSPTTWLLAASFITIAIWAILFSNYKYLVPLEMLAPILSVASIGLMPFGKRVRLGSAVSLLLFLSISTITRDWIRMP